MKYRVVVLTAVCMLSNVYAAQPAASASMQKKLNSIWAGPQQTQERSAAGRWVKKPNMTLEAIAHLAVNDAQNIWATSWGTVYKWENNAWKAKGEKELHPRALSVATDNSAYAIKRAFIDKKRQSRILRFDGEQWQQIHAFKELIDRLVVINQNDIWITKDIKPSQPVPFHWDGKKWEQRGWVYLSSLDVGVDGTVMGIEVKISGDELMLSLVQWDGKQWKELFAFKEPVVGLALFNKNNIWIEKSEIGIEKSEDLRDIFLYKWDPKNKQWIKKGKMIGSDFVVGRDGSLWSSDRDNVYQWVENGVKCETGGTCTAQPPLKAVLPETINVRPSQPRKTNGGAQKTPPFIPSQTN